MVTWPLTAKGLFNFRVRDWTVFSLCFVVRDPSLLCWTRWLIKTVNQIMFHLITDKTLLTVAPCLELRREKIWLHVKNQYLTRKEKERLQLTGFQREKGLNNSFQWLVQLNSYFYYGKCWCQRVCKFNYTGHCTVRQRSTSLRTLSINPHLKPGNVTR